MVYVATRIGGIVTPPENNCIPLTKHSEVPLRGSVRCTKICVGHTVACKLLLCTLQFRPRPTLEEKIFSD